MKGFQLKFYTSENRRHKSILLYEWLIETAKQIGVEGGYVFRSITGFGKDGVLHEERFFELGSNMTVEVMFILSQEEYDKFQAAIEAEKLNIFFVKTPIEYGMLNGGASL